MNERQQYIQQLMSLGLTQEQANAQADQRFGVMQGTLLDLSGVNMGTAGIGTSYTPSQQANNLFNFNPSATVNSGVTVPATNPLDALYPYNQPSVPEAGNLFPGAPQVTDYRKTAYTGLGTTYAGGSDANSMEKMTGVPIPEDNSNQSNVLAEVSQYANLFNPYGVDTSQAFYTLGRAAGANPTTTEGKIGQGLELAGAAGKALFGTARDFLSGYGNSVASQRYWEWQQRQLQRQNYTPASQTANTSSGNRGGLTVNKYGGRIFTLKKQ